jgi:hypothetical protein
VNTIDAFPAGSAWVAGEAAPQDAPPVELRAPGVIVAPAPVVAETVIVTVTVPPVASVVGLAAKATVVAGGPATVPLTATRGT